MEQLVERYKVFFDYTDEVRYFSYSWEAVHYACENDGAVYDLDRMRIIADCRPEPYDTVLRG